ncbi:glycerol-3-phosphate acyltransferase 1-like [Nicotiana tabacum]|uniref:Glycerol-3-phosphate acyltransferase 1-like n=1 Tax=Nicotiana tabacum TaxID=4097 RepID=A0A1S4AP44_TOBAC|nr:PREDICTED: glycerol-3-phosphate acyltransferase 1-like [Nicotiana tabacum]
MKFKNSAFLFRKPSFKSSHQLPLYPNITTCNLHGRKSQTLVCDIHGTLLRSQSFFPYFMLVAFEGGSIFRAFFLLLSSPFLCVLNFELQLKVMIFITFCGLRLKNMDIVGRAVLPKFYLENLNLHVYEVINSAGAKMVFTSVPRVMVEGFLKEYLNVDSVIGTELHTIGNYFSGLVSNSGLLIKHRALKEFIGERKPDIGIGTSSFNDHLFISFCKEAYVVNKEDMKIGASSTIMPREKYPKPLIFHDGRLAFLPTPLATLSMFIWFPLGIFLAIFRISIGIFLPYKLALFLATLSGVKLSLNGTDPSRLENGKGVLYVCNHRTLLDPVFLSILLGKPLTAVTYSLSKMSEFISPIKTMRLTRDREQDRETMQKLLSEGDLVVCPEGTTCREPYLLRFSSLFAELTDEIVPVAVNTNVTMFYGNTASGFKCLDPIFFLMNPRPSCTIEILGKVPKELTCAGVKSRNKNKEQSGASSSRYAKGLGKGRTTRVYCTQSYPIFLQKTISTTQTRNLLITWQGGKSTHEVANYIQRQLADALGFECTKFTRRDKYLMLAGNKGLVMQNP